MNPDLNLRILDETPDAIIAVAPDGVVMFWNRAAEQIFGYSNDEAMGRSLVELIVPDDLKQEEGNAQAGAVSEGMVVFEGVRRRKDGTLVHVGVSTKAVKEPDGSLLCLVSTNKDITHLKAMRDSATIGAKFRDLLELTPDAIVIVNVTGRIVFTNSQAEKLFGYEPRGLIGREIEMLLPQRYRGSHLGHRGRFFSQPKARAMGAGLDLSGLRRDGSEFPVEISLSPLRTEEGTLVMSAIRDTTDRKRAEKKFRDLLESAPDAMIIVNAAGKIVLVNSQAERLFGWTRDEMLGQSMEMLVPQRFRGVHPGHRGRYFGGPKVRSMGAGLDLFGLRRDGTEFPVEISLSPIETEDGMLVSSAIRDVSDRKEVERSLQQASRLKSEFLANMSHELRTPLNGIIGFAELLVDGKAGAVSPKQKEYLHDVLSSGRHLLLLINDLLDLSKIEAGRMDFHPEEFAARTAIDEVCAIVGPMARGKEIAIDRAVAQDCRLICLDLRKFKQVLYNLVSNAVKFTTERGKVRIELSRRGSGHVVLAVSDTGIGIKEADLAKLFIEFQQLESGSTRRFQGTGLGLALTKRIVEAQNGTIQVQSEPDKGSTFTVEWPPQLIASGSPPEEGIGS